MAGCKFFFSSFYFCSTIFPSLSFYENNGGILLMKLGLFSVWFSILREFILGRFCFALWKLSSFSLVSLYFLFIIRLATLAML